MIHFRRNKLIAAGLLALLQASICLATGPAGRNGSSSPRDRNVAEVESILERLEKKLTDNESGGLTGDEQLKPASADKSIPQVARPMKFGRDAGATGSSGEGTNDESSAMLRELTGAVASLETKVERLHADIQKARLR